ncbi:helix-turn-helix domain-containing protein [Boudabousia marimammalium]|uniref:helix-turn-helix domain-containing protein n=1 Tax=Boudabousia marimammalium TaxID=156892 RepID=UPI00094BF087|nr:helix-turn-helix transcriptional regulator [Boudabousia marimammalium]
MTTLTIANTETPTISSIVAANIRAEAARAGINQVKLGRMLNMTQSQVSRRWNGSLVWTLDEMGAVAQLLGVSVADLVTPPRGNSGRYTNPPAPYGTGGDWLPRQDSNLQPSD